VKVKKLPEREIYRIRYYFTRKFRLIDHGLLHRRREHISWQPCDQQHEESLPMIIGSE
jgi:hypothetical protein